VFGSTDINIETWKPLQRLVGHSSGESSFAMDSEREKGTLRLSFDHSLWGYL
jgi:hypothetical protein